MGATIISFTPCTAAYLNYFGTSRRYLPSCKFINSFIAGQTNLPRALSRGICSEQGYCSGIVGISANTPANGSRGSLLYCLPTNGQSTRARHGLLYYKRVFWTKIQREYLTATAFIFREATEIISLILFRISYAFLERISNDVNWHARKSDIQG